VEQVAADGCGVGEDPDAEDDHHAGGELGAHPELVAEVDDHGRDQHVADERDHEDLVVEDPVEEGAERAEHRIERSHDRDRQVGLERQGHVRGERQAEGDPDDQPEDRDHEAPSGSWLA
jgi:hypothetical protein